MLCQGSATGIMWPDQWTISTVDGGRSAQFEHTVSNLFQTRCLSKSFCFLDSYNR
jgi:hypothetical protein